MRLNRADGLRVTIASEVIATERPKRRHAAALQRAHSSRDRVFQRGLVTVGSRRNAQSKSSGGLSGLECGGMTPLWPFGG